MTSSMSDAGSDLKEVLLADLRDARWLPGQRLPTERQLGELHGVSRSAVRRALGEMKGLGLITQKVGSGTYVAEDVTDRLPKSRPMEAAVSPADLMEARLVFEPSLVELAVRNGTSVDFARMDGFCRNAGASETLQQFEHWDVAFHHGLAESTHNSFLVGISRSTARARDRGEWGLLKRNSATPGRRAAYQREHEAVLAALRQRDAMTARRSLLAHLTHVYRNMFNEALAPPVEL